jgi:pentatricopeptide repeat protein
MLISMDSKCEDIKDAVAVFDSLDTQERRVDTWTAMIGAHAKEGQREKALSLFDEMVVADIRPDKLAFLAGLSAIDKPTVSHRGKELHSLITKAGLTIDDSLRSALITMYSNCDGLLEAVAVFNNCPTSTKRGVASWTAVIGAHVKRHRSFEALALFEQMLAEGTQPDEMALATVLPACGDIGALAKGKKLHALIEKGGLVINDFLGAALINMYGRTNGVKSALPLFEELRDPSLWDWHI